MHDLLGQPSYAYADDVILISKCERGLQNCLEYCKHYCDLWCLDIDIDKTKATVFNKSGNILQYNFCFNGHSIKNVQTYIWTFNKTSRYLDDLLNIDNIYFDGMGKQIYP